MANPRELVGYKNTLNRNNLMMLAPAGSELLELNTSEGDVDDMGICIESPAQLLGFAPFEQDVYRSAAERTGNASAKSEPGDVDLAIYGLRKFVRLVMGGNPNLVAMLFVPRSKCRTYTPYAKELQELTPKIVSLSTSSAFLGYLRAQRDQLNGSRGGRGVTRPDLVERYGFDTKFAMHAVRLGIQGSQLMRAGRLEIPMLSDNANLLRNIRNGQHSLARVLEYINTYEERILMHHNSNSMNLPAKPDYAAVEKWLLSVYKRSWNEDTTTPQQQRAATDQIREDADASGADGTAAQDPDYGF